jgi:hypothetical protein
MLLIIAILQKICFFGFPQKCIQDQQNKVENAGESKRDSNSEQTVTRSVISPVYPTKSSAWTDITLQRARTRYGGFL